MQNYLDSYGINEKKEETSFEHFCNYTMFTHCCPDAYDSDQFFYRTVHTGEGGDTGIDGILCVVNDVVVTDVEQAKEIIGKKKFEARFIFVQAKTSSNFESGEMLKVGIGVRDFFTNKNLNTNKKIQHFKELADYIFSNSINFKTYPTCQIFYVTTGKWVDDANLNNVIANIETMLNELNYFQMVRFVPVDAIRLASTYKEISNSITREIVIAKNVAFPPDINAVEQAYLGLVQFEDYLKLITDEDGMLQYGLFYDNVRSYLGENPVNKEIIATLQNKEKQIQFPILNNGITIVAKSLKSFGDKFTLTDFQIVNGCQTTNVLYKNKGIINPHMMIPVKIVNTEDSELINDVIRSTNRQTQVLDEAFESLKTFHKQLQDYYNTYNNPDRIYYERRTHEYEGEDAIGVRRSNIVTIPSQLLSVISMFYGEPHSVHRYYGELLRANANKVFQSDHKLIMYYTSAWTLHRIEVSIRNNEIDAKWRRYRYHYLTLIYVYIRNLMKMREPIRPNSHDMERLCNSILKAVNDKKAIGAMLRMMTSVISKVLLTPTFKVYTNSNAPTRRKEFTQQIIAELEKTMSQL